MNEKEFKEKLNERFRDPELGDQLACSSIYFAFTEGAFFAKNLLENDLELTAIRKLKRLENAISKTLYKDCETVKKALEENDKDDL